MSFEVLVFPTFVSFSGLSNPSLGLLSVLMADDMISRCAKLKITADEREIVNFDDAPDEGDESGISLSLVGKVFTIRPYNFEAMKRNMNKIWSISKGDLFRPNKHGRFVVQFANNRDKIKVTVGRPWTLNQNLVMLKEIEGSANTQVLP